MQHQLFHARQSYTRAIRTLIAVALLFSALHIHASVALLMEEPYGEFGAYNPTGHAAVYLNHICAESPTRLRACRPNEYGVVISRYHKIHHDDWIAIPLIPYLYAVDDIADIPASVDKDKATELRNAAWRIHLQNLAPATADGNPPKGEWTELIGSSYDRTIHGFQVDTTTEQDERFMAIFNDTRNVGHFNLLFHNCADFSREVLDTYFPHAIHRNYLGDMGVTTPKQAANMLVKYGKKHPELHMTAFVIPQVPGTIKRSTKIDGVSESLVKSKKYILPLAIIAPEVSGALVADYLVQGRTHLPRNAVMFEIGDDENGKVVPVTLPGETPQNAPKSTPPDNAPSSSPSPSPAPSI